jgi:mono/diheme cytochrome c family protein
MKFMRFCGLFVFAVFALAPFAQAQTQGASQEKKIEKVPMKQTSPASGAEMYKSYCSACHGKEGKGDGPAASALKAAPANLTLLAKNNKGQFPADHVATVLKFGSDAPAHGSKDMPTWGPLFGALDGKGSGNDATVQLRIHNLTEYIKSLQAK